jgi:uncharacterized protein YidB (DUF937 family)
MNSNPLLGQVLGGLFGQALGRRGTGGGLGGALGGGTGGLPGGLGGALGGIALGSVLAGALRNHNQQGPASGGGNPFGNRSALLMMLLPLAMRWVQRNGGMGAVLDKFRQKGLGTQAQSWMSTGANVPINEQSVEQMLGPDELREMAQRLGVPEQQVAQAFAEIMPEMVDKMTPQGDLPHHADEVLDESTRTLEKEIEDVQFREVRRSSP